jgi:FAD/FMN-containing dehydrogenase
VQQALALLRDVRRPAGWARLARRPIEGGRTCSTQLQEPQLRASWKRRSSSRCSDVLRRGLRAGDGRVPRIHQEVLRGRVWVALHMHAGDGNVHTNIPVNSDNYAMLQTAHEAVARIMALARSLDGVISGEHGIGITKLEFLTDDELAGFTDYKRRVDPEGRFNKGKLLRGG